MHLAFSSAGKASLDYVDITKLRDIIDERAYSSLIGIVTAIIGNVLISLALNTQRYAHIKLEQRRLHELEKQNFSSDDSSDDVCQAHAGPADRDHTSGNAKGNDELRPLLPHDQSDHDVAAETDGEDENYNAHYLQSPWWWLGITLMTVGECGNFLAYGFAPASVVSPLGVVALVANCLIAPWMLREHFRVRDGLGVIIAIAGCVVVVLSAAGESDAQLDAAQIWALIATWEFELYLGITLTLIVILVLLSTRYGTKYILVPLGLVGLFGGYTALATKAVASLLSQSFWRIITFPLTYLLVAVLIATAVLQIKYINLALQAFSSTQVIPTQFVLFTISVIVGSAVLYRDFEKKTRQDALEFFGGCLLTFLGVWCITAGRTRESADIHSLEDVMSDDAEIGSPASPSTAKVQTPIVTLSQHDNNAADSSSNMRVISQGSHWGQTQTEFPSMDAILEDNTLGALPNTKPPMISTASSPVVHRSYAPTSRPKIMLRNTEASPNLSRNTLLRSPEHEFLGRSPMAGSATQSALSRILPNINPLTSPLSGSLNAVVLDSLRRDVTSQATSPRRTLRSSRSQGLQRSAGLGLTEGNTGIASPQDSTLEPLARSMRASSDGAPTLRRGRTVSSTIVDFFNYSRGDGQETNTNAQDER